MLLVIRAIQARLHGSLIFASMSDNSDLVIRAIQARLHGSVRYQNRRYYLGRHVIRAIQARLHGSLGTVTAGGAVWSSHPRHSGAAPLKLIDLCQLCSVIGVIRAIQARLHGSVEPVDFDERAIVSSAPFRRGSIEAGGAMTASVPARLVIRAIQARLHGSRSQIVEAMPADGKSSAPFRRGSIEAGPGGVVAADGDEVIRAIQARLHGSRVAAAGEQLRDARHPRHSGAAPLKRIAGPGADEPGATSSAPFRRGSIEAFGSLERIVFGPRCHPRHSGAAPLKPDRNGHGESANEEPVIRAIQARLHGSHAACHAAAIRPAVIRAIQARLHGSPGRSFPAWSRQATSSAPFRRGSIEAACRPPGTARFRSSSAPFRRGSIEAEDAASEFRRNNSSSAPFRRGSIEARSRRAYGKDAEIVIRAIQARLHGSLPSALHQPPTTTHVIRAIQARLHGSAIGTNRPCESTAGSSAPFRRGSIEARTGCGSYVRTCRSHPRHSGAAPLKRLG